MIKRHEEMIQSQYELHTKKKLSVESYYFKTCIFGGKIHLLDFGGHFSYEQICICKRFFFFKVGGLFSLLVLVFF